MCEPGIPGRYGVTDMVTSGLLQGPCDQPARAGAGERKGAESQKADAHGQASQGRNAPYYYRSQKLPVVDLQ